MDSGTHPLSSIQKNAYKRRFTDEQIKFLEFMFESESRPESRVKQQLASELGLEPRQVAIWFQNRRARLKTKQIEKEYSILKASYDVLASSFESLKREKQSLIIQVSFFRWTIGSFLSVRVPLWLSLKCLGCILTLTRALTFNSCIN
jgi:homeobox-leucine zipper protein